jgi:hypothetical protein
MAVLDWSGGGHSRWHGSPDLARKAGSDHEIARCSLLLRFETRPVDLKTDSDGGRGTDHKPAPSFCAGRAKL